MSRLAYQIYNTNIPSLHSAVSQKGHLISFYLPEKGTASE